MNYLEAGDCYYNNDRVQGWQYLYMHYCKLYALTIFYSNTIFYRLTWEYNHYNNEDKKYNKIKSNQRNHTTPKLKLNSDILIIIIGGLLRD